MLKKTRSSIPFYADHYVRFRGSCFRCSAGLRCPPASPSVTIVFLVSAARGSPQTSLKSTRSVSRTRFCLDLARAVWVAAALEIAARDGSRFVLSPHREIYVDGELAHALDLPRDHPRTRQTLSHTSTTFRAWSGRGPRFMIVRPRGAARSPPFRIGHRQSRPRVARTTDAPSRPSSSVRVVVPWQVNTPRTLLRHASSTATSEKTRSRTDAARCSRGARSACARPLVDC